MKKLLLLTAVTFSVLAAPITSFAQSGWTSSCSAGATIDEASRNLYATFGYYLTFRTGKVGTVQARYDVTNTSVPNSFNPPWTTFQLDCFDTVGGEVTATLFQYEPCEAVSQIICTVTSNNSGEQCQTCDPPIPVGTFDFTKNVYWITVDITRNNQNDGVRANALRVYP